MKKHLFAATVFTVGIASAALAEPTPHSHFNLDVPLPVTVFAVVGSHVLQGQIGTGLHGRTVLTDGSQPGFSCAWTGVAQGRPGRESKLRFDCSDGSRFQVSYDQFEENWGVGHGSLAGQPVTLAVGFGAKAAIRHLAPPTGYILVAQHDHLTLRPLDA